MLDKAYVLKTADGIITFNCEAFLKNNRLIVNTNPHSQVSDVWLNTDAAVPYEIRFYKGPNRIAMHGATLVGNMLVRSADTEGHATKKTKIAHKSTAKRVGAY